MAEGRRQDGPTDRPAGRAQLQRRPATDTLLRSGRRDVRTALWRLPRRYLLERAVALVVGSLARHRVRVTTGATYEKQLRVVNDRLGEFALRKLRPEHVTVVIADIAQSGSAARARNIRMLLVQLMDEAVNLRLTEHNVAKRVRSPRVPKVQRRTLSPAEMAQLVSVCDQRYAAAVALCFVQGWRVSEALGLAWQDLDLVAGTVRLRRGATDADRIGMVLGPPKTSRTAGRQLLAPTTLTLLAAHRDR